MEIKSAKDMIKKRNYLLRKLQTEYIKLDKLSKNPFKDTKEKNTIYGNIQTIKDNLYIVEKTIYDGSHVKSNDFYYFITDLLKLTDEDLEIIKIRVADIYPNETLIQKIKREKSWKKGIRIDDVQGKWCYFITDSTTKEIIDENIFDEYDLEDFIDSNLSKDTIIIDTFNLYPFNKDLAMKEEYRKHKKIKNAIYELIDLKIKQPELTDEERFQIILQNTVRRNLNKSYKKKKESK